MKRYGDALGCRESRVVKSSYAAFVGILFFVIRADYPMNLSDSGDKKIEAEAVF
jgi:hypothetical protein